MTPRPASLVFLLASALLHAEMLFAIAGSARGAAPVELDEQPAARWEGSTFEIEGLLGASPAGEAQSHQDEAPSAEPSTPEPAPSQPVLEQPSRAVSTESPTPAALESAAEAQALEPPPPQKPEAAAPEASEAQAPSQLAEQQVPSAPLMPPPPRTETVPLPAGQAALAPATPGPALSTSVTRGGVHGAPELRPGVGSLAKAFTRAVPRAAFRDPVWHGMAMGAAGSITFSIELDAEGHLVEQALVIDKQPPPPDHLSRLVARTALMLKAGSFALGPAGVQAGKQRLELSATIRKVEALDDELAEPRDLRQIGRLVEPTWVRPGKANFTYNSGRQVELTVRMLAN